MLMDFLEIPVSGWTSLIDLLEDSVDVDGEGFNSLLVSGGTGLGGDLGFLGGGTGSGFAHFDLIYMKIFNCSNWVPFINYR